MYCSKCGTALAEGAAFCGTCGQPSGIAQPMSAAAPPVSPAPSPIVSQPVAAGQPASWPAAAAQPRVAYAGFWLRVVASLIDGVIIGIPVIILFALTGISAALSGAIGAHGGDPSEALAALFGAAFLAMFGIFIVARWLYFALMESSSWQATVGKKALGLYVTDITGQRVSFGRATGRNLGKFVSDLIPLAIGYILAGFTEKKQALHDMIASCLVLRKL